MKERMSRPRRDDPGGTTPPPARWRRAIARAGAALGLPTLAAAEPAVPTPRAGAPGHGEPAGAAIGHPDEAAAAGPAAGLPSGGSGPSADLTTLPPGSDPFRRLVSTLEASGAVPKTTADVVQAIIASSFRSRDHETIGHSCRVARLAVALAERIGLRGETLTAIEWGALLHDVGKTAVPPEILDKPGPLAEEEMAVIRQHPRQGYQMLKHLVFLGAALDIVLSHHERWDGRGYPNGLAGERIPLPARVFAVVDTYDAITSDRPYRAARGHEEAIAELRRVAGTQLDPRVVDRFLDVPEAELRRLRARSRPADPAPERRAAGEEPGEGAVPLRRRNRSSTA